MMPEPSRPMAALRCALLAVLAGMVAGCAVEPAASAVKPPATSAVDTAGKGESELLMAAENALRDNNCRAAAENYLAAARASSQPQVASRASQLAVGCNQLDTARAAVARWLELEPYAGDASLAAALIALKRYDLKEARAALTAWRDSGSAGSQDPLQFAELLAGESDATALYRVFGDVLVGDEPTAEVLLAQSRLALAAQNMRLAISTAQRALALDSDLFEAQTIVLRAMSVMGEHNAAIQGARALPPEALQGEDVFLVADLLTAAERQKEAREELLRLDAVPESKPGAERRLLAMDIREGDFDAAEQRLGPMMGERGTTAMAILFFAQLAERRGDDQRAIQSYRLLADSSLGLSARASAARLMFKAGDSKSALALLDDFAEQNPDAALDAGTTRAQLLAQFGDVDGALKSLDSLSDRYPGHPDLQYQRATVLETGGRTRAALTEFERALKQRPDDPQLMNALGFTLADHKQQLPHAEQLVRAALAISPDNPAIQDSLGWVLFRRDRPRDALPILALAWQNSGDPEIAAHYGEALWKTGDEGQARYIWQQALNGNPQHTNLLATMSRLTGEGGAKP